MNKEVGFISGSTDLNDCDSQGVCKASTNKNTTQEVGNKTELSFNYEMFTVVSLISIFLLLLIIALSVTRKKKTNQNQALETRK